MSASQAATSQTQVQTQTQAQTRAFVIAWFFTVVFYFLEYAEVLALGNDFGIGRPLQHLGTWHRHNSGSVLLHLFLDESGRRGCFGSSGSQALRARRNGDSGFGLPAVQRAGCAGGRYWTPLPGCGLCICIHWRRLFGGTRISSALPGYCYRRHAMRRNARWLGWTECRRAND